MLVLANAAVLTVVAVALFCVGAITAGLLVSAATIFQLAAPDAVRGRVESLVGTVAALGQLAAFALAGLLSDLYGARLAMHLGAAVVALAALYALLRVRSLTLPATPTPEPAPPSPRI